MNGEWVMRSRLGISSRHKLVCMYGGWVDSDRVFRLDTSCHDPYNETFGAGPLPFWRRNVTFKAPVIRLLESRTALYLIPF